jgi:hypothetical protein
LLFATFDPETPPLLEYLGEVTWYLDVFFDRREGGVELVGARRDVLRRVDGVLMIARRKLTLDQNVLSAKNVSIFF